MNTTLDMFNLFGLNGMHSDGDDFNQWATTELKKLFPFLPNIKSDSEIVYSNIDELNKFKDSKILILCGGPSTSEVDWSNLDYDYVWSLNSFFLNDKFKNTKIKSNYTTKKFFIKLRSMAYAVTSMCSSCLALGNVPTCCK